MKLKTSLLAFVVSLACASAWAQDEQTNSVDIADRPPETYNNPNAPPQQVFYKWNARGKTYYAKFPPRGVTNFRKINGQGMLITDRLSGNATNVLRPLRPVESETSTSAAGEQPLGVVAVSREQRCIDARRDLKTIQEKPNILVEDGSGNLIQLSAEQVSERKKQTEDIIERYCQPQPIGSTPAVSRQPALPPAVAPAPPIPPATEPPPRPAAPIEQDQDGMNIKEKARG